ncbi:MAG TPA: NAD(P)-dependent oxidoreductase [Flavobacteriaceae bacterium]|nr:NAD(P)-dependent oxidoreductase [Flavobacteriaceae bacterium]
MKIGIIAERKNPPERRVVFSPEQLVELKEKHPEVEVVVEPSETRVFSDREYREKGFKISDNMSDCDILIGVKEVPIHALIANKKYFFFSHTIKEQEYNRNLLRAILEKNITLYDHEVLTDSNNRRLVGFGRYAGIAGAYNGFRALGLKEGGFDLPKMETLHDFQSVKEVLKKVVLPRNFKILLTGRGKVANGAKEILEALNIREVNVKEYLNGDFDEAVFCQIHVLDYNKRRDGRQLDETDFYRNPDEYVSDFMRFAKTTDYFITGHYYANDAPYLFTREDAKNKSFNISLIADISCDIDGPVASTIRASTIASPFYGYDPQREREVRFDTDNAITVMAVDNLPCEIPKDASEGFGKMFLEHVVPAFFNGDKDGILERAKIAENGELTENFAYLQQFLDEYDADYRM